MNDMFRSPFSLRDGPSSRIVKIPQSPSYPVTIQVSSQAKDLLDLLQYFDAELIQEALLTNTHANIEDPKYGFLTNESAFRESVEEICRVGLATHELGKITLNGGYKTQLAHIKKMDVDRVNHLFDLSVQICFAFISTWAATQSETHFAAWEASEAVLPHVRHLMAHAEQVPFPKLQHMQRWIELVFRMGEYLLDTEQPNLSKSFFEYGLKANVEMPPLICARVQRLRGNVHLDLAQPNAAFRAFEQALTMCESLHGTDSLPVAQVVESLAYACSELRVPDKALEYLDKAASIHRYHNSNGVAHTTALQAMTYLRDDKPDYAKFALEECWRVQGKTRADVEESSNPKNSGDIMLLARILWAQGKHVEGQELASRTIGMRRNTFGGRGGPRVADSLFTVACMLEYRGQRAIAKGIFRQIIEMCGDATRMRPHAARSYWFLARVEEEMRGGDYLVLELRSKAREIRALIESREFPDDDTDEGFQRLVSWMLW